MKDQITPKGDENKILRELKQFVLDKKVVRKGMEKHTVTKDKVSTFGEQKLQRRKTLMKRIQSSMV